MTGLMASEHFVEVKTMPRRVTISIPYIPSHQAQKLFECWRKTAGNLIIWVVNGCCTLSVVCFRLLRMHHSSGIRAFIIDVILSVVDDLRNHTTWLQLDHNYLSRQRLRSSTSDELCVPAGRLPTIGHGAFPVAGARIWNDLPADVTSAPSLLTSRQRLKLHLFRLSYPGLVL